MSGTVIGQERVLKPRKEHWCFLCTVPIPKGEAHDRWCWVYDGSISRLRAHDDCKSYAHDCIDGWANGDGVEDNAVETDLWERVTHRDQEWRYHINEAEVASILATWPGLAPLIEKVRAEVRRENKEQEDEPESP